jgi:hypothetical protein
MQYGKMTVNEERVKKPSKNKSRQRALDPPPVFVKLPSTRNAALNNARKTAADPSHAKRCRSGHRAPRQAKMSAQNMKIRT